jgi:hypothetical protein
MYAESTKQSIPAVNDELVLPCQDVLQQLYHLAMMGDISAIEEILKQQVEQNNQLVPFITELTKLTTSFQTAKIRKFIKSLLAEETLK